LVNEQVRIVGHGVQNGQGISLTALQQFVNFLGLVHFVVLCEHVGYTKDTQAVAFVHVEDLEVLDHRISEAVLLLVYVLSLICAR
jgi:hypothetical protein